MPEESAPTCTQKIDAAIDRSAFTLAFVAFVAVAREGFETVLFLLSAETFLARPASPLSSGAQSVSLFAALLGYLFYLGSDRVDLKKFFKWTGLLLILFAAGLSRKGCPRVP